MKTIPFFIFLFTAITISTSCKNKPGTEVKTEAIDTCKWSSFDYFYAKAYIIHDFQYADSIEKKGDISKYVVKDKTWYLTNENIAGLDSIFCGRIKNNDDDSSRVADCFNPRHGIIFYNKQRQQVAHITICFECHQIKTFPKIGNMNEQALSKWCEKLGMPVFDREEEYYEYYKQHGH